MAVPHLLQRVGGECRAVASSAVQDNRLVGIGTKLADISL